MPASFFEKNRINVLNSLYSCDIITKLCVVGELCPFAAAVANKHAGFIPFLVSETSDRIGTLPREDAPGGTTGTELAED